MWEIGIPCARRFPIGAHAPVPKGTVCVPISVGDPAS
jgi:hypothetical protein